MNGFSEIPEGQGIVTAGGVYRQVALFERADAATGARRIYAKYGSGYVRLNAGGTSSATRVRWTDLDVSDGRWEEDGLAVVYVPAVASVREAAE